MKIKSDFITNSSSSSFIVVFPNRITNFKDVEHLITGDAKAKQVLKDALKQKSKKIKIADTILIKKIIDELKGGYIIDTEVEEIDYFSYQISFCEREGITQAELYGNKFWLQSFYDEFDQLTLKVCSKKAIEFIKENVGEYLYIFEYSDGDGAFFSDMEHGGTFNQLPHITVNKH